MGAHKSNPTALAVARGEQVCRRCGTPLGWSRGIGAPDVCAPGSACATGAAPRKPLALSPRAARLALEIATMIQPGGRGLAAVRRPARGLVRGGRR